VKQKTTNITVKLHVTTLYLLHCGSPLIRISFDFGLGVFIKFIITLQYDLDYVFFV